MTASKHLHLVISLILAVVLVFSFVPISAFATEGTENASSQKNEQLGESNEEKNQVSNLDTGSSSEVNTSISSENTEESYNDESLSSNEDVLDVNTDSNEQAIPEQATQSKDSDVEKNFALSASAQIQTYGWKTASSTSITDPIILGTTGEAKRLEAIKLSIPGSEDGGIEYQVHAQTYGWMGWQSDGAMAGTEGQAKRLEAVQIKLTGALADQYDIYYRAHVSKIGWMDWAKNGESAGTQECKAPLEAIQIVLVSKGEEAPGGTTVPFIEGSNLPISVKSGAFSSGSNSWTEVSPLNTAGTTGQKKALVGIRLSAKSELISGGISYSAHLAKTGWTNPASNGAEIRNGNAIQAIKIHLTGDLAKYFDIYYRAHVSGYGWMGWAKNGSPAGSEGLNMNMEAYQVAVVLKGTSAPGTMANSFSDANGFLKNYLENKAYIQLANKYSSRTNYLIMVDRGNHRVRVFRGSSYNWSLIYNWSCVTGAPGTPTIVGENYYTTGFKRTSLSTDSRAIWCTQIWGGYFFHSILASESELGHSLSHGCIRLPYSAASWIYNNIYAGTRVVIYN